MKSIRVWLAAAVLLCASTGAFAGFGSGVSDILYTITSFSQPAFTSSVIAEASFHTYGTTAYDSLRTPWQWPYVDADRSSRHVGFKGDGNGLDGELVWTQIGNTSEANTFGAAWLSHCKKGYVGAQVAYDHWRFDDSTSQTFPPDIATDGTWDKTDNLSVFAGYGWEATDKLSIGVGVEYFDGRDNFKTRDQSTAFGGSQSADIDERTDTNVVFGVKGGERGNFTWTAEARVGQSEVDSYNRNDSLDTSGMITFSTVSGDYDLDADRYGVGTNLTWYRGDKWDHQVSAYWENVDWNLKNTMIDYDISGGMTFSFNNVLNDDITETYTTIAYTAGWHEGPTHAFFQVGYYSAQYEADIMGDFGNPGSDDYGESEDFESSGAWTGVSVVHEFTPRFAGIVGGEYQWYQDEDDYTFRDLVPMAVFTADTTDSHGDSAMRVGLEYRAPHVILDFVFGDTEANGLEAINNDVFYGSVQFNF